MLIRFSEQFVSGQIPLAMEYVSDRNACEAREIADEKARMDNGAELLNIVINVAFTFCARR